VVTILAKILLPPVNLVETVFLVSLETFAFKRHSEMVQPAKQLEHKQKECHAQQEHALQDSFAILHL